MPVRHDNVDITGLEGWQVMQALYNAAKADSQTAQVIPGDLSDEHAQHIWIEHSRSHSGHMLFTSVGSRFLYVAIDNQTYFSAWRYDKYNGEGTAMKAIAKLRLKLGIPQEQTDASANDSQPQQPAAQPHAAPLCGTGVRG